MQISNFVLFSVFFFPFLDMGLVYLGYDNVYFQIVPEDFEILTVL